MIERQLLFTGNMLDNYNMLAISSITSSLGVADSDNIRQEGIIQYIKAKNR